jgi:hypothetical protein
MSEKRKRRKRRRCQRCLLGGYEQGWNPYTLRPSFRCTRCGETWTCGLSGGEWLLHPPTEDEKQRAYAAAAADDQEGAANWILDRL